MDYIGNTPEYERWKKSERMRWRIFGALKWGWYIFMCSYLLYLVLQLVIGLADKVKAGLAA